MKASLFDKIQRIVELYPNFQVDFNPMPNICNIHLNNYPNEDHELMEELEMWLYDELGEKLIDQDAFAESINTQFEFQENSIIIHVNLNCSDRDWDTNQRHCKEEIISPGLIEIISRTIKLDTSEFDPDSLYLCLEYHEGKFNVFEVIYFDQAIAFQDQDETSLKKSIGTIFDKWNGVFWGSEALSVEKYIEMDQSAYFHCYDIVTYEFEFEKSI